MATLRSLPVPEVTELNGAAAREAVRSATGVPPTPPQAAGGSPQAQEFRAQQGARVGPTAGPVTPGTGPGGATAALRGFGARAASAAAPVVNAAKKFGPAALATSTIGSTVDSYNTPTSEFYDRTGIDPVATHVPQAVKDVGVRALGTLQNVGNAVTFGLADRVGNALAGNGFNRSASAPAPAPATAPAAPALPATGAAPVVSSASAPAGLRDGVVTKTKGPNGQTTYSGDNVKEGAQMVDAAGNPTARQLPEVGVYPGMAPSGQPAAAAPYNGPGAPPGTSGGFNAKTLVQGLRETANAQVDMSKMPRSERIARAQMENQQQIAAMEDGTRRYTSDRNADVTLRGQDLNANVSLRGQDMTSATARVQGQMQRMQQDRQYQLDVAKLGDERAKTAFTQREAADKGLTEKLSTFHTRTVDGKAVVDNESVAEHKQAINAYIGEQVRVAEKAGRPDLAEKLRTMGAASIDDKTMQQIGLQLQAKKANAENSSKWLPWKGTHIDSADPAAYDIVGMEKNTLTPNQYVHRNGSRTPVGVLDYVGGDPILNYDNQRTTRFDSIKQEKGVR